MPDNYTSKGAELLRSVTDGLPPVWTAESGWVDDSEQGWMLHWMGEQS